MMELSKESGLLLALIGLAGLFSSVSAGVVPKLGENAFIYVPTDQARDPVAPAVSNQYQADDGNLRYAMTWMVRDNNVDYIWAAVVDEFGVVKAGPGIVSSYGAIDRVSNPGIAVDNRGYFSVAWSAVIEQESSGSGPTDFNQGIFSRTYRFEPDTNDGLCPADGDSAQTPGFSAPMLGDTIFVPDLDNTPGDVSFHNGTLTVDMDSAASGRTVVVFPDHRSEPYWGIWAIQSTLQVDSDAVQDCDTRHAWLEPDRGMFRITGSAEARAVPRVAVNENNNRSVVVWRSRDGAIQAQRLDAVGNLEGNPIEVSAQPGSVQESLHDPDVDYGADDTFRVVWERSSYRRVDSSILPFSEIRMSRYTDLGIVIEDNVLVEAEIADNATGFFGAPSLRNPRVNTQDLDGDFAVTWSRQQGICPSESFPSNWFVQLVGTSTSCSQQSVSDPVVVDNTEGNCTLQFNFGSSSSPDASCRAQVRMVNFGENIPRGGLSLQADSPLSWDDVPDNSFRPIKLEFSNSSSVNLENCALILSNSPYSSRSLLVRQPCRDPLPGAPSNCTTCEEQAQALGIELPSTAASDGHGFGQPTPIIDSPGVFAETDIRLRWFQADWQSDEATDVASFTVNSHPTNNGRPAIGMGRDSDMMLAWISDSIPYVGVQSLTRQSLAAPVELSINDVGILEGPLARATANFTVSANKPYPFLPEDCANGGQTPQPSVTLLTTNDSATFQSGDYERTTRTLTFADRCNDDWQSQLAFSVPVFDDTIFEDVESFFVDLFDETNAIVVRRQGVGAIVDNDAPSIVQPPGETVYVCEDGNPPVAISGSNEPILTCPDRPSQGFVEVPVELNQVQEVEGSVEFISIDGVAFGSIGGAQAPDDYEAVTGELQFLPGNDRAFLSINLNDDGFAELTEEFFVELTGADNLTLPADLEDRRITVRILDNDDCAVEPQWVLPDGNASPTDPPPALPQGGTTEELTGYVCVINPDGYDACPWASRLDLNLDDGFWLSRLDIPFDPPPPDPDAPPPPSAQDIADAQAACASVNGATGAIRYVADPNTPTENNTEPQSRTGELLFINGRPDPYRRFVSQEGSGACEATITPAAINALPIGGEFTLSVDFGEATGCEFNEWSATLTQGLEFISIDDVSTSAGNGEVTLSINPYLIDATPENGLVEDRAGNLLVASINVPIIQEAPLFDHFDDGILPSDLNWLYTEPLAWSESGTHLTADTESSARLIATPIYPGCSRCLIDTAIRFDDFSKGRVTIYLWWQSEDDHLRLVADEFFDRWILTQRVDGTDHEIRQYLSDVQVGVEYPVRIEFRDDLGSPLILVDINGEGMCTTPQAGPDICTPYDSNPDPDPEAVDYVIGAGSVGFGVEATRASFNLLRVIRADRTLFELDQIYRDRFEAN